jgi:hypothetical protein
MSASRDEQEQWGETDHRNQHKAQRALEKRRDASHTVTMGQPIDVDLPHKLGKEAAKKRIGDNVHKLHEQIPGGGKVQSHWEGDTLKLSVAAMGEAILADLTVHDDKVHCHFDLPGMLGMFAGPIAAALKAKGSDILLEDHRG